jgi:hypothetical protein
MEWEHKINRKIHSQTFLLHKKMETVPEQTDLIAK